MAKTEKGRWKGMSDLLRKVYKTNFKVRKSSGIYFKSNIKI